MPVTPLAKWMWLFSPLIAPASEACGEPDDKGTKNRFMMTPADSPLPVASGSPAPIPTTAPVATNAPVTCAAPSDLPEAKKILTSLLEASSKDGNIRKREQTQKQLHSMYCKLQSGLGESTQQKIMAMLRAIDSGAFSEASRIHTELTATSWDENREWLPGAKRLLSELTLQ